MDVRVRRRSGQCRRSPDEAIVRAAREGAGDDCLLMVDAGASNTFWPHGLKWALRTADMVKEYDAYWLEEASERVRGGGERAAGCSGAAWGLLGRCVT
jgi:L-alanine-DL-glutamate epimerase-like enolase superfamily enzyme